MRLGLRWTAVQAEAHSDLGAVAGSAQKLHPFGEGLDEGEPEPLELRLRGWPVGTNAHALVRDDDLEAGLSDPQANIHRTVRVGVGVDDDVVAGLAHRGVDVEQPRLAETEYPQSAAERLPHHRDIGGSRREHQSKLRCGAGVGSRFHPVRSPLLYARRPDCELAADLVMALPLLPVDETNPCSLPMAAIRVASAPTGPRALPEVLDRMIASTAASSSGSPSMNESRADSTAATAARGSAAPSTLSRS